MIEYPYKSIRHTARDGTKFWVHPTEHKIETDRPDTWLERIFQGPMNQFKRLILTLDGRAFEFAGEDAGVDSYPFEWTLKPAPEKTPPTQAYWRFSSIRKQRGNYFQSRQEQDQAVNLLTDMLSNFNGGWTGARHGEKSDGIVEFSDDFQQKLDSGYYIQNGDKT